MLVLLKGLHFLLFRVHSEKRNTYSCPSWRNILDKHGGNTVEMHKTNTDVIEGKIKVNLILNDIIILFLVCYKRATREKKGHLKFLGTFYHS